MRFNLRRLLFSLRGRIARGPFWLGAMIVGATFVVLLVFLESVFGRSASLALYPPLLWTAIALTFKRLHDLGKSPLWLIVLVVPILGPLWLAFDLGFRRGTPGENQYGQNPLDVGSDYLVVK
jgi:uncharacterized membrane protein YhaH (DUF805 family)